MIDFVDGWNIWTNNTMRTGLGRKGRGEGEGAWPANIHCHIGMSIKGCMKHK